MCYTILIKVMEFIVKYMRDSEGVTKFCHHWKFCDPILLFNMDFNWLDDEKLAQLRVQEDELENYCVRVADIIDIIRKGGQHRTVEDKIRPQMTLLLQLSAILNRSSLTTNDHWRKIIDSFFLACIRTLFGSKRADLNTQFKVLNRHITELLWCCNLNTKFHESDICVFFLFCIA